MNLTIEIPDDVAAVLKAQASAQGVTTARYVSEVIQQTVASSTAEDDSKEPFETGYGMWANYGTVPSFEEIEENRREMFRKFAQDIQYSSA